MIDERQRTIADVESALASQKATGGKTQVVVEWVREDEE